MTVVTRLDAAGGPAATTLLAHASARNFVDDPARKRTPQRRRSAPGVDAREVNESRKRLLTLVSLVSGRRVRHVRACARVCVCAYVRVAEWRGGRRGRELSPSRYVSMRRRGLSKRIKRVHGPKSTRADSAISTRARRGVVWNALLVSFPSRRATHSNDALDASHRGRAISWPGIDDEHQCAACAYRRDAIARVIARRVA